MSKIAISYRRSDSQDITGRIFDRLVEHYGKDTVFRDIDNIRPGIDFRKQIADALRTAEVLVVVVGPRWLGRSKGGEVRMENEADPVRIEVETALGRGIPVIPLLVGGSAMPTTTQLPGSLRDFAYRHAVTIDGGRDFDHHVAGLVRALDELLAARSVDVRSQDPADEKVVASSRPTIEPKENGGPESGRTAGEARSFGMGQTEPPPVIVPPSLLRRFGLIGGVGFVLLALLAIVIREETQFKGNPPVVSLAPAIAPDPTSAAYDRAKSANTLQAWDEFLGKVRSGQYKAEPWGKEAQAERDKLAASLATPIKPSISPQPPTAAPPPAPAIAPDPTPAAYDRAKSANTLQAWDEFLGKVRSGQYKAEPWGNQAQAERDKLAASLALPLKPSISPPPPTTPPPAPALPPPAPKTADDFAKLRDQAKAGDASAAQTILHAAAADNIWAMYYLADIYDDGLAGFPKDPEKYRHWLTKAASSGNGSAMQVLSYRYEIGDRGFAKDPKQAYDWLLKSAKAGDLHGMYNLAKAYLEEPKSIGLDAPNQREGARWYLTALRSGSIWARVDLIEQKGHWIGWVVASPQASRKAIVDLLRESNLYGGPAYDGAGDFDASILAALEAFKNGNAPLADLKAQAPPPAPAAPKKAPPVVPLIPVGLGDNYNKVRTVFHIQEEAKPYLSGGPGHTVLDVDAQGISFFFDSSKTVYAINFHKPFAGSIWGVKLGDSKDDVKRQLGEPEKSSSTETRFYYSNEVVVDFDFSNKVVALIL